MYLMLLNCTIKNGEVNVMFIFFLTTTTKKNLLSEIRDELLQIWVLTLRNQLLEVSASASESPHLMTA